MSCQVSYSPSDTTTPQNIAASYAPTDNSHSTSSGNANLTVIGTPPQIISLASTTFTAGMGGSFTATTSGTPTPSLSYTGSLPNGVTFKDNGNGTATLGGTTTSAGSFPITITAQNGVSPNATQNFTLTVNPAVLARRRPRSQRGEARTILPRATTSTATAEAM